MIMPVWAESLPLHNFDGRNYVALGDLLDALAAPGGGVDEARRAVVASALRESPPEYLAMLRRGECPSDAEFDLMLADQVLAALAALPAATVDERGLTNSPPAERLPP